VTFAGRLDERELFGADAEAAELERTCESGAPRAVRWIVIVADPLSVVQDGEKNDGDHVAVGRPQSEVEADRGDVTPVILAVEH